MKDHFLDSFDFDILLICLLASIFIFGYSFIIRYALAQEISNSRYEALSPMLEIESVRPLITDALSDGIVTNREFNVIEEVYGKMSVPKAQLLIEISESK